MVRGRAFQHTWSCRQCLPAYLVLSSLPPETGFTFTSIIIQIVRPYLGTASRETYTGITTGNVVDDYGRTKHNQPLHDDTGAWGVRACNDNDKWQTDRAFQQAWSCLTMINGNNDNDK